MQGAFEGAVHAKLPAAARRLQQCGRPQGRVRRLAGDSTGALVDL
jgi:hypothetical protein